MARVFVEIPDVTVVAVWKSVSDDPLVLPTVTTALRHDPSYQRGWPDIDLQPLIRCNHNTRQKCWYKDHWMTAYIDGKTWREFLLPSIHPTEFHSSNHRTSRTLDCSTVFIARQKTDARYWYSNSVRPSVRLSVCLSVRNTLVLYENGWTYCHSFFTIR